MKNLKPNISLLAMGCVLLFLACSSSERPMFILDFKLPSDALSKDAHEKIIDFSKLNNLKLKYADQNSLSQVSGRPGFIFMLWIFKGKSLIINATNLSGTGVVRVSFLRSGFSSEEEVGMLRDKIVEAIGYPYMVVNP